MIETTGTYIYASDWYVMQQSKALYFIIFFLNFIVQKQKKKKKFEPTSEFSISLDLCKVATFVTNYDLQVADKPSQAALKWLCGILVHSRRIAVLRWSTLWYFLMRTLLSKMP